MDLISPWHFLALGLLLTLTPVPVFYASRVKFRSIAYLEIARRNGSWWRVWRNVFLLPGHWIELARSYLGMRCLLYSLEGIRARGLYPGFSSPWMVAGMALGTAILALLLMLVVFRSTGGTLAPVAFVSAAVLAVMPLEVGGFALILAVVTMIAFKSLAAFFAILTLGLAGFGLLFGRMVFAGAIGAGFAATPVVLAFLRHRELVIPVRHSHSKRSVPPRR